MSIIDLVNGFVLELEHTGDNEIDQNQIIIRRDTVDANGDEIDIREKYLLTRYALLELLDNLQYASSTIQKYLNENYC